MKIMIFRHIHLIPLAASLLLLTACIPSAKSPAPSMTAAVYHYATPVIIDQPTTAADVVDSLVDTLYFSYPDSPQYDPQSTQYAQFPEVVQRLGAMGANAADAVDDLALAVSFPRKDAYLAGQALLKLGPDLTSLGLPILIDDLNDQKPAARIFALVLLGSTGRAGACSVGHIGPLLWDQDSSVRTAAALALENITGEDLIEVQYEVAITPSFMVDNLPQDTPDGTVVSKARGWWSDQGSKIDWHPAYDICDP